MYEIHFYSGRNGKNTSVLLSDAEVDRVLNEFHEKLMFEHEVVRFADRYGNKYIFKPRAYDSVVAKYYPELEPQEPLNSAEGDPNISESSPPSVSRAYLRDMLAEVRDVPGSINRYEEAAQPISSGTVRGGIY